MTEQVFQLRGGHIELHVLLKLLALADSGGMAKALIADGQVQVDGQVETRKAKKIRAGQVVRLGAAVIRVVAAP